MSQTNDEVISREMPVAWGVLETNQFGEPVWFDFSSSIHIASETSFSMKKRYGGNFEPVPLFTRPMEQDAATKELVDALEKIIEMNRTEARDKYGNAFLAENWGCVLVARSAIAKVQRGIA